MERRVAWVAHLALAFFYFFTLVKKGDFLLAFYFFAQLACRDNFWGLFIWYILKSNFLFALKILMIEFISVLLLTRISPYFMLAYVSTAMLRYFSGYRVMPTKWFVSDTGYSKTLVYIYHLTCPDVLFPIIVF